MIDLKSAAMLSKFSHIVRRVFHFVSQLRRRLFPFHQKGTALCGYRPARLGEESAGSKLIWVHISALRGKLAQIDAQAKIRTYRRQGYALEV